MATPAQPKSDGLFLCYRCQRCMRLITKLQMLEWRAFDSGRGRPNVCLCGAGRISATNPVGYERWLPRVVYLRLAVYASPPFESWRQQAFSYLWRLLSRPLVLPPPPPPTEEEIAFANQAKRAQDGLIKHMNEVAERLAKDDIPLEDALIRTSDEEASR